LQAAEKNRYLRVKLESLQDFEKRFHLPK
jgi:hypothetical protein